MVMSSGLGRWEDDENARIYDSYARTSPQYQLTSQMLVQLAEINEGQAVVDLCCGTGMTTAAILDVLQSTGSVTSIDGSSAMIRVASRRIRDPRVRWVVGAAEDIARHVEATVDAVVSNQAIWQTDLDRTLPGCRDRLPEGGCLAFTVPAALVGLGDPEYLAVGMRFGQLMHDVAATEYGVTPQPLTLPAISAEPVGERLRRHGFELASTTPVEYEQGPDDHRAFWSIPVFTEERLPGLSYGQRMDVIDKVLAAWEPPATIFRSIAFVARRRIGTYRKDRAANRWKCAQLPGDA
jgi:SAM-dependent methyltransferase